MHRHWRSLSAAIGLLLVVVAVGGFVLDRELAVPSRSRAVEALPNPSPIIDPKVFPSPLALGGNLQIARDDPLGTAGWSIRMPQLGIKLTVVQGDGLNVPYYKAAHYPTMAWPGQGNRSMLYAHAQPGMFGPLFNAHVGQDVYVDRPGGAPTLHYVIRQYYPAWPDDDLRWLQPTDHEELVLLTCTSWNAADPRIIAVAEPVS